MFKKNSDEKKRLQPHWTYPARHVEVFQATDTILIGVSPAEIVVLDGEEVTVNEPWPQITNATWDGKYMTLSLGYMDPLRDDTVIKCTQSPTDMFMHSLREGIDKAHLITVEHKTPSGANVQMWILQDPDSTLRFHRQITGQLTPAEEKEIAAMAYRMKDSVGLE